MRNAHKKILAMVFATVALMPLAGHGNPYSRFGTPVEIVFCVDLSGSTNGIIDRLRDHFWDYINVMTTTSPKADYRIGFIGYGRPSFGKENAYVRVIKDLTYDMESIAAEMLSMRSQIEKGDQYLPYALSACVKKISWRPDSTVRKVVFLVGNGFVNMNNDLLQKSLQEIIQSSIIVNTVYLLNNPNSSEQKAWEDIALLTGGKSATMNVRHEYFENLTGFDYKRLYLLSDALNKTYLYYGAIGKERWLMQQAVDKGIFSRNPEGFAFRMHYRISEYYLEKNASWDLIDLHTKSAETITSQDRKMMPDNLRHLAEPDLRALVIQKKYERNQLIKDIKALLSQRENLIAQKTESRDKRMKTFDVLTIGWLKVLLASSGYTLKN